VKELFTNEKRGIIFDLWTPKILPTFFYGRKFTPVTDHQPLRTIFNAKKGIPPLSVARWALVLSAHSYSYNPIQTNQGSWQCRWTIMAYYH